MIYEKTKGQVPLGPLLGKQKTRAKEIYLPTENKGASNINCSTVVLYLMFAALHNQSPLITMSRYTGYYPSNNLRSKRFRRQKLVREQKKRNDGVSFFGSRSNFRAITRLETLATQAIRVMKSRLIQSSNGPRLDAKYVNCMRFLKRCFSLFPL